MHRKYGALTSSQDSEKLQTRIKGIVIGCSSIIIYAAAKWFNIELTTDNIVELATQIGMITGAITTVYGAILAIIAHFAEKE